MFFEAVGLALDVDNGTVVKDAVEDSEGDGDVGKDLVPLGEGFVGGKDGRSLFITFGNELKEKVYPPGYPWEGNRISSMMSILYLAWIFSLSDRRFSKWAFLSCSMS